MNMRTSGFARSTLTITFLMAAAGAINSAVCLTQVAQKPVAQEQKHARANPKLTALLQRQKKDEKEGFEGFVQAAQTACTTIPTTGFMGKMVGSVISYAGSHFIGTSVDPKELAYAQPFFAPVNESLRTKAIEKVASTKESAQQLARVVEIYAQRSEHSFSDLHIILHQVHCAAMGLDPAQATMDQLLECLKEQGETPSEAYFDNLAQAFYLVHLFGVGSNNNKLNDLVCQIFPATSHAHN